MPLGDDISAPHTLFAAMQMPTENIFLMSYMPTLYEASLISRYCHAQNKFWR